MQIDYSTVVLFKIQTLGTFSQDKDGYPIFVTHAKSHHHEGMQITSSSFMEFMKQVAEQLNIPLSIDAACTVTKEVSELCSRCTDKYEVLFINDEALNQWSKGDGPITVVKLCGGV